MKNLALKRIQEMKPYNPPLAGRREFNGMLLDFNERTIPPSVKVQKEIQKLLKTNTLQIYPEYGVLENKLAKYTGVQKEQVMITNGSDQAIDLIFRTFTKESDTVIIPTPTFAMFTQCAQIVGNKIVQPYFEKNTLSFPLKEVLASINEKVKLIVVCNPNSPTGTLLAVQDIEVIAKKASNAIILVDEAYFEFSNITVIPLIKKYPNIVVTRTLSKAFGIPSLRVGYIVASKVYINELLKVRGPYDINMLANNASIAALEDVKGMKNYVNEIMKKAKPLVENFFQKNNITFFQSSNNFILYKTSVKNEEVILRKNGILVRPQNKTNIENTLRVTIGTVDQMKKFIKVYQNEILNKQLKKVAFLDRDGTLIFEPQDTYQIDSLDKLKILEGVIKGLKELKKQNYQLIMISNQDGLGTKSFPKKDFDVPQNKMLNIFEKEGIRFDGIFICPHFDSEKCECRKPKLGLVKKFLSENKIDKNYSFVCGDRASDKAYAKNLGVKYVPMKLNGNFIDALIEGKVIV